MVKNLSDLRRINEEELKHAKDNVLNAVEKSSILTVARCRHFVRHARDCRRILLRPREVSRRIFGEEGRLGGSKLVEKKRKTRKSPHRIVDLGAGFFQALVNPFCERTKV